MKTKIDIESFTAAAEEISRQIIQLRESLGIRIPPHVSDLVQDWASGPAKEVDTIDGINPHAFSQGPFRNISDLDDIPENHVLVGLGTDGEVIIRGTVFPDYDITWLENYNGEQLLALDKFYDQLDLDEIFPNGAIPFPGVKGDWELLKPTENQSNAWKKDLLLNAHVKGKLTAEKTIVVSFKPDSCRIISAQVDEHDLMPMVSQPEPENLSEHDSPEF